MKAFVERLSSDKAFAAEFKEFLAAKNEKVKEGTKLVGEQLNKLVMGSIREFAASKGITLTDDEQTGKSLAGLSKQICMQMDEMIVKSFAALEGSMKQPVDVPPEFVKAIRENKETYLACMHEADKAAEEAVESCGKALDAAVAEALKSFSEKTGYQGAYHSFAMNKAVSKKLNEVIGAQIKGLMQISKTAP